MKILTFDIEEWYIEKIHKGDRAYRYAEFDAYLDQILNLLKETGMSATFFCVGKMAVYFPEVIKKIAAEGHEIGCHSYVHTWLNKMSRADAMEDTRLAVDALEQCVGKKIKSYRAPAFSIDESNKWAFEVLAECGIEYDSSIFPAARDFGGFSKFGSKEPAIVNYRGVSIKEFPIPTTNVFGKELAFSGGGYFRFFPLWFVKKEMKKSSYSMCYFHIGDLLPETSKLMSRKEYEDYFKENGSLINRYKRFIKGNLGKKSAWGKLQKLILSFDFQSLDLASDQIKWDESNIVVLD